MRSLINLLTIFGFAAVVMTGCYPEETKYYSDTDVVVTRFNEEFTFENDMLCVLFDSVAHVVDEDDEPKEGKLDQHILDELFTGLQTTKFNVIRAKDSVELEQKLADQGFTRQDIDLAVTTTALETDYYNYYYYPWNGYWGWGYGWGWYWKSGSLKSADAVDYYYYPYYPWGGGTYYAYTTGTIMIDMLDVKGAAEEFVNAKPGDEIKLPVVWSGTISGILSSSTSDIESRITSRMEQAFNQSPELK